MRRMFSALIMTAALGAPMVSTTSALAAEPGAQASVRLRIYDPYRRDFHVWDRHEQEEYRAYLYAHHRPYVTYQRQRDGERRNYWRWRHEREERREHERR